MLHALEGEGEAERVVGRPVARGPVPGAEGGGWEEERQLQGRGIELEALAEAGERERGQARGEGRRAEAARDGGREERREARDEAERADEDEVGCGGRVGGLSRAGSAT